MNDLRLINDEVLGRRHQHKNVMEVTTDDVERITQMFPGDGPLQQVFRKQLRLLAYPNLERALQAELESLPALAAKLGKEAPLVIFEHDDYALSEQLVDGVRQVFIHLFRNSLDHGLESASQRIARGKDPRGCIRISLHSHTAGRMRLVYRDDGSGLNLERIRLKAQKLGLDQGQDLSSPENLANLIFFPSFSTKGEVDEVSGRGVGMDAVKSYWEELGGSVSLKLETESGEGNLAFSIFMDIPDVHLIPLGWEKFQMASAPWRTAS
jgi:hypothetical protein